MECLGPECVSMLLEWLKARGAEPGPAADREGAADGAAPGDALDRRRLPGGRAGDPLGRPSWPGRSSTSSTPSSGDIRTS